MTAPWLTDANIALTLVALALLLAVACIARFAVLERRERTDREDAEYARLRTDGMGDLRSVREGER